MQIPPKVSYPYTEKAECGQTISEGRQARSVSARDPSIERHNLGKG